MPYFALACRIYGQQLGEDNPQQLAFEPYRGLPHHVGGSIEQTAKELLEQQWKK
jgi:hypothetical protein